MLEWNVFIYSFNGRRVERHNIFDHSRLLEDCKKALEKFKDDKDAFLENLRKDLMYYYWAKCEWEIIISHWPPRDDFPSEKVDVYDQVMMNWHAFSEYVWENRNELKKAGKK